MDKKKITIYDTTLRDGSQGIGISFSLQDKIRIARELDRLKIDYIEGGWPGANPKDTQFFEEIKKAEIRHSKIAAFSSTKRHKLKCDEDPLVQAMINSDADVLSVFAKTWDFHVTKALGISLEDNLNLIYDTIAYMKDKGYPVFMDAEHFFDGYRNNPDYAIKTILKAKSAGVDMAVLCDTNGGVLPDEIYEITKCVFEECGIPLGIHCHNDSGTAVANSLSALKGGAVSVQGTINGLGERCGNADLCSIIPNALLKMNYTADCSDELERLTEVSRFVSETANIAHNEALPFVGGYAFAHKAGIHVSAVNKDSKTYEHISPELVGNKREVTISDQSGKSNFLFKAKELGIELSENENIISEIISKVKKLEDQGFQFESAEASLELFIQEIQKKYSPFFLLKGFRIISEKKEDSTFTSCEASIKIEVNGETSHTAANGNGPVAALDNALRKALISFYPEIDEVHLSDYKVRVLDSKSGTGSSVRVLMEQGNRSDRWTTIGVSENIIEASWQAMVDGIEYMLYKKKQGKNKEQSERV